jgi:hypothetical protein
VIFHFGSFSFLRSKNYQLFLKSQLPSFITFSFTEPSFSAQNLDIQDCQVLTNHPKVKFKHFAASNLDIKYVVNEDSEAIRKLLRGVEIIPGCGEYVLDPEHSLLQKAFNSLDELKTTLPGVQWISPVVGWFASSLKLKECKIRPGIDTNYKHPGSV